MAHDASCLRYFESLVLLGLLEFSDVQFVQELVEAYHLASLQDSRHLQFVRVPVRTVDQIPYVKLSRSRDSVHGTIFSFSWYLD